MNIDQKSQDTSNEEKERYLRREPIPENYFLIWKDEKMQEWDRFIYNVKWNIKTIHNLKIESYDDILSFYKINFDIFITLNDLIERPYLVRLVFKFKHPNHPNLLLPSDDDFKKLIFWDIQFFLRLSNVYFKSIDKLLIDVINQKGDEDHDVFILGPYQDKIIKNGKLISIESMTSEYLASSSESKDDVLNLQCFTYDKPIPGLESLTTFEVPTVELEEGLIYLSIQATKVKKIKFPNSLRSVVASNAAILNNGLIEFLSNNDEGGTLENIPSSLECLGLYNLDDEILRTSKLPLGLKCLSIDSNIDFSLILDDVAENLKVLKIDGSYENVNLERFTNLEIFITTDYIYDDFKFPPNLKSLEVNALYFTIIPSSVELLIVNVMNIEELPKSLKYLKIKKKTKANVFDLAIKYISSLIYLYINDDIDIDLNDFPNLKYLEVGNESKIKNMRDDIMFKLIQRTRKDKYIHE